MKVNGAVPVVGSVKVATTQNRGLPVEHWAERLLTKIVHVAENSESPIKAQALIFKNDIRIAIEQYMKLAISSDRTTLYNLLLKQGETEMAEILRRL